jgi:WD40 repeat protein
MITLHSPTKTVLAAPNGTIEIQDKESGACLKVLEGHRGAIKQLAISHNSTRLASVSRDKTVKIWDISNGECLQTLEHHEPYIIELLFSDDSTCFALRLVDNTISIWDINSGTRLQTLKTCNHDFVSDVFSLPQYEGTASPQEITHCNINISADHTWITRHDEEWLWLPIEYRPGHFAISGGCITVITKSGKTWTCHFV